MIELTRLNGHPLHINCDLLKLAEAAPDTVLTLITGEKLIVRESCAEVAASVLRFRSLVLMGAGLDAGLSAVSGAATALAAKAASNASAVDLRQDPHNEDL